MDVVLARDPKPCPSLMVTMALMLPRLPLIRTVWHSQLDLRCDVMKSNGLSRWAVSAALLLGVAATGPAIPAEPSLLPPPGAAAAGLTTLALNSDFTQPLPKNWLGGCPNGPDGSATDTNDNTGHIWYNNFWWGAGNQYARPCDVKKVTDRSFGGTILDLSWQVHHQGQPGGDGHTIQTAGWNWPLPSGGSPSVGFAAPNNAYYEMVARSEPRDDSNTMSYITWAVTGITGGDPGTEWDPVEIGGNGGGNGAIHNWGAGGTSNWIWTTFNGAGTGNDLKKAVPNYDPGAYHAWGLRTTSDGTSMVGCAYLDNVLIKCVDLPGGLTQAEKTQRLFVLTSTSCYGGNYNNSCPLEGKKQHSYIKSIRVWSCDKWQTTQCNRPVLRGAP